MKKLFLCTCCICLVLFLPSFTVKKFGLKTRVIVLTDVTSLTSGFKEPDDGQSLTRLMLYTNELDIEGLIATSNLEHGQAVQPGLIQQVVEAYGKVRNNLLLHDVNYPTKNFLLAKIKSGNPIAGKVIPILENIGKGKNTEGSDWIIKVVNKPDPRPLWITIWGGGTDLAQALWTVKNTRSSAELKKFLAKIKVHAIGDQDGAGPWIRANFPDLFYFLQKASFRGMYRGGDTSLVSESWVRNHIKNHGALGDLYPVYNGGDIWAQKMGRVSGIKEGDTPSFLSLLSNGLNDEHNPEWLSWGGRFVRDSLDNQFVDAVDSVENFASDPNPNMASVYRWRKAFQNDFAARMNWCQENYDNANHAPVPEIKVTRKGDSWMLDASGSKDPDGNGISYSWFIDRAASTARYTGLASKTQDKKISLQLTEGRPGQKLYVVLQVNDDGTPSLTRYKRVLLDVK